MAPGVPDSLYVAARRVLLDALEAVGEKQRDAMVLVGAQAIYVHTGEADLAVAPFTADGDLAIHPEHLQSEPLLETMLLEAGFDSKPDMVGVWIRTVKVDGTERQIPVDLLVPASLGGAGRRSARIPPHGNNVARKVAGLEGTLVDRNRSSIAALDSQDNRNFTIWVAGPAALLVAKLHKISDRTNQSSRIVNKDALDVYRILYSISTNDLAARVETLKANDLSTKATVSAIEQLRELFAGPQASGCRMAVQAAGPLIDADTLTGSLVALAEDLLRQLT